MINRISSVAVLCLFAGAAHAGTAGGGTQYDQPVNPGWFVGSGMPNANFVINDNAGTQTGLNAHYRFGIRNPGDFATHDALVLNHYTFRSGESFTDGTATANAAGTAAWNIRFHANLNTSGGTPYNIGNSTVLLTIDWDPGVLTNIHSYNLSTAAMALGAPATTTLIQDSQNLGFSFWNDPGFLAISGGTAHGAFDPNALGTYTVNLSIINGGNTLSSVDMFVHVVPAPGAAALLGLGTLTLSRRRRA